MCPSTCQVRTGVLEWKQKWDAKKHGISDQSHPSIMTFLPQRNPNAVPVARFGKQLQVRANGTFAMGPNLEPRVAMVDERERRCGGSPDTTALELGASGNIRPKKKHKVIVPVAWRRST